jgi:hypothetical protein
MVTANSTLLTTIYDTERMYVNFSISEQRPARSPARRGCGRSAVA